MSDKITRNAHGIPQLTARQRDRAHRYALDIVANGFSRRSVSPLLLGAALAEIAIHAKHIHTQLQQFLSGAAQCAPAKDVAKLAIQILSHIQPLSPADQVAYLSMLLGDDESLISNDDTDTDTTTTH